MGLLPPGACRVGLLAVPLEEPLVLPAVPVALAALAERAAPAGLVVELLALEVLGSFQLLVEQSLAVALATGAGCPLKSWLTPGLAD